MKGKCLECENYYLAMRYQKEEGGVVNEQHRCKDPEGFQSLVQALSHGGVNVDIQDCDRFRPKEDRS